MRKKRHFRQLKTSDRDRMEALLSKGHNQSEVAIILKVDKGTISRERKKRKKKNGYYDADVANHKAQVKRGNSKFQGMKIEKYPLIRNYIISELMSYQSPDAIAGRMKRENWPIRVSADAIYRWLRSSYGQQYCKYLCTKRYNRKTQKHLSKRQIIPNLVSIHDMPADLRFVAEGDTFLSPKKVSKTAAVLVGWRESKLLKGDIVKSLRPIHTKIAMRKINDENKIDAVVLDQGIENILHKEFGMQTFFCDPACPRQKPFIECSIGLCRRWFWPKGTNLAKVSKEELKEKIEILNHKYRKSLNYMSAYEVALESGIIKNISSNVVSELHFTPEFTFTFLDII